MMLVYVLIRSLNLTLLCWLKVLTESEPCAAVYGAHILPLIEVEIDPFPQ